jgi:membrane fusion protein
MLSSNQGSRNTGHSDQSATANDSQLSASADTQDSPHGQRQTTKKATAQGRVKKKAPLYREEAVRAQDNRLEGNVLITHSLTSRNFALFYLFISLAIIGFLYFGSYTRKITVVGFLEPETGLSKVYPIYSGRVSDLMVSDGDMVKKGDRLAKIIIDSVSGDGGYGYKNIASEIEQSITTLGVQRSNAIEDYTIERKRLGKEVSSRQTLLNLLVIKKIRLKSKNKIVLRKLASLKTLQEKGSISHDDYNTEQIKSFDSLLSIDEITTLISKAKYDLTTAKLDLEQLPVKHAMNLGEIDQKISDLRRELIDAKMRHAFTIMAPIDGRISALTYRTGDSVDPEFPILSIIPELSKMQAKLYMPSSSISFLHVGQDINIQYQALPVQRFGTYPGKISHVSTTPVNPNEFKAMPTRFDQPMYVVIAEIFDQNIELEDSTSPIIPGMAINISLLTEKQTILEWIIDPFWNIKGRFQ